MKKILDKAITYGQKKQISKTSGQSELFSDDTSTSVEQNVSLHEKDDEEKREANLKSLHQEKKVLGLFLSGHPINEFKDEITSMGLMSINYYLAKLNDGISLDYSSQITIAGVIVQSRSQRVGNDRFINILTVDDATDFIEVIIYPDIYEKYKDMIKENEILFISGLLSLDDYNGSLSIKATSVVDIDFARQNYSKQVELMITSDNTTDIMLDKLLKVLEPHKNGKCPLIIKCISNKHIVPLSLNQEWKINLSTLLINNLSELLGSENIIIKYQ